MSDAHTSRLRTPLISKFKAYKDITDEILNPIEGKPTSLWYAGFALSSTALLVGIITVAYQILTGIGTWGLNKTVGWGWDITNFVFGLVLVMLEH